jgi:hypothetical protein
VVALHIEKKAHAAIMKHLQARRTEQVVFLFLKDASESASTRFEVVEYYLVPPEELVFESEYHAEVSPEAQAKVIKMAWDKGVCLSEIHSHPHSQRDTSFSPSDLAGFADFVPHVWWRLKGKPYLALVCGRRDFDALAWVSDPRDPVALERLIVGDEQRRPTGKTIRRLAEMDSRERERYSRQTAFFGAEGQWKIKAARVVIVGLGGLGSHVVQQLAYLGVQKYALIDYDEVTRSNLNRLIGATEADLRKKKTEVAGRFIHSLQPKAEVRQIEHSLLSKEAFDAIAAADLVFGCVDDDGVRLVLLELCCAHRKPYLDLASDMPDETSFGGRVIFSGLGRGCPMCKGELDQKEIWRFFATTEQRAEDDRVYGVKRSELGETGPSVVMLNGVIASLAVTEFVAHVTGIRRPVAHLIYRGEMGTVNISRDAPTPGCYYCEGIFRGLEMVDLSRHLKGAVAI